MWIVSWVCIGTRMFSPSTSLNRSVNNNYNSANRAQATFLLLCRSKLDQFTLKFDSNRILSYFDLHLVFGIHLYTVHSDNVSYHRYKWRKLSISLRNSVTMSTHTNSLFVCVTQKVQVTKTNLYHLNNMLRVSNNLKKKSSQIGVT